MSTKIFYFSGSGNSLAIARAIAERVGNTEILPIAKHMEGFAGTDEERIGLVTPVFAWGPPRMVRDFAGRLQPKPGQYTFAVATCAGTQGRTLMLIRKILRRRGSDLDAGFAVRGDFQVVIPGLGDMPIIRLVQSLAKRIPARFSDRLSEIAQAVSEKRLHRPEKSNWPVNAIGSAMHAVAVKMFKKGDTDFSVTDACVSCGICARVCPRANVMLVDDRPSWHQNCEMCYACLVWCPEKAILLKGHAPTEPTHHPDVELANMLLR